MIRRTAPSTLALAGVSGLAAAALCGELAILHMAWLARTYGVVCGEAGLAHCPACPASLALAGLGLTLMAAAGARRRASLRSRGR